MATKLNVPTFRTAGMLYFIGAILIIILVGFLLLFIAAILQIVAFFAIQEMMQTPQGQPAGAAQLQPGTKFCSACGTQMPVSSEFCPKCGAKQP